MKRVISIILAVVMCLSTLIVGTVSSVSAKSTKSTNKGFVVKYNYKYKDYNGTKHLIIKGTYPTSKVFSFYYNGKSIKYNDSKLTWKANDSSVSFSKNKKNISFKKYCKVSLKFKYKSLSKTLEVYSIAKGDVKNITRKKQKPISLNKSDKELLMKYIYNSSNSRLDLKSANDILLGSMPLNEYRLSNRSFRKCVEKVGGPYFFKHVKNVPSKCKKRGMKLVNYLCKGYYEPNTISTDDPFNDYVLKYCVKDSKGEYHEYYCYKNNNKGLVINYNYTYKGSDGVKDSISEGTYDLNKLFSFYYNGKKINYDGKKLSSAEPNIKGKSIKFKKYGDNTLLFKYKVGKNSESNIYSVYVLADGSSVEKLEKSGYTLELSKSDKDLFLKVIYSGINRTKELNKESVNGVLYGSVILNSYKGYKDYYKKSFREFINDIFKNLPDYKDDFKKYPEDFKKGAELVDYLCNGGSVDNIWCNGSSGKITKEDELPENIKYYVKIDKDLYMGYYYFD